MLERIKSAFRRIEALNEAARLSEIELDDIGLTRSEVADFIRIPEDATDRFGQMATIFGVSDRVLRAHPADYLSMLKTCSACRDRAACGLAMDRGDLTRPGDCGFCPNARALAEETAT